MNCIVYIYISVKPSRILTTPSLLITLFLFCITKPQLVKYVAEHGKLPVVNFAAGGVATPADAALMMQLGMDGVFVGSGIFKSQNPEARAKAIVRATTHYNDPKVLMEVSTGLGPAMVGICDIKGDPVNFRDREGGEYSYEGRVPPKKHLTGKTETQLYGSTWESTGVN